MEMVLETTLTNVEKEERRYIRDEIVEDGEILTGKVFRKISALFNKNETVYIKDYGEIKDSIGKIVYVGSRFATVELSNGYKVSINYGSILDNQNQKGEVITRVEFFDPSAGKC